MLVYQKVAIFNFCHVGRDASSCFSAAKLSNHLRGFATSRPTSHETWSTTGKIFFPKQEVGIWIEFDILSLYHILGCSPSRRFVGIPYYKNIIILVVTIAGAVSHLKYILYILVI